MVVVAVLNAFGWDWNRATIPKTLLEWKRRDDCCNETVERSSDGRYSNRTRTEIPARMVVEGVHCCCYCRWTWTMFAAYLVGRIVAGLPREESPWTCCLHRSHPTRGNVKDSMSWCDCCSSWIVETIVTCAVTCDDGVVGEWRTKMETSSWSSSEAGLRCYCHCSYWYWCCCWW